MIAALLGVLRSGAAYLPIDPDLPRARLEFIADDAARALLLTDAGIVMDAVSTVEFRDLISGTTGAPPPPARRPVDAVAYVIYTSGSTGQPKGVGFHSARS